MGLQFKINEADSHADLEISAEDSPGNKNIAFFVDTEEGKEFYFDVLGLEELLELGVFLNHKIGFELINIKELKSQIEIEKQINKTT